MKRLLKNESGQALIFVILILLVVFFIAVSVSLSISRDTVNSLQNQDSQQSYSYAEQTLKAARDNLINGNVPSGYDCTYTPNKTNPTKIVCNIPAGTTPCINGSNLINNTSNDVGCSYTVDVQTSIDRPINTNDTLQINTNGGGSGTGNISLYGLDSTSTLVVNIISQNGNWSNEMCLFIPDSYKGSYIDKSKALANNAPTKCLYAPPANGNNLRMITNADGSQEAQISIDSYVKYIRVTVMDNTPGSTPRIVVNGIPGSNPVQYKVTANGYYNGTRRTLQAYFNGGSNPPSIFDYVLFNSTGDLKFPN